jgi:uncharacterized membrane protein (DUF2068 family)
MDWSLLGCGARGHITFAPDEPDLRERLSVSTVVGTAWRCLRCGTFVPGQPAVTGPAATAPRVKRGKELRSAFILRVFAIERFLRALVFLAIAYGIWRFAVSRLSIEQAFDRELPPVRELLKQLGYNVDHSKLLGLIQHTLTLNSRTLTLLALAALGYAIIELVEGLGLWLGKRWGEYFAVVVTGAGVPFEIYELTEKITALRLVAFLINLALVVYLIYTRRLFGVRGGRKAYEARLRTQDILETGQAALAATDRTKPSSAAAAPATAAASPDPAPTAPRRTTRVEPENHVSPDHPPAPEAKPGPHHPPPASTAEGVPDPGAAASSKP